MPPSVPPTTGSSAVSAPQQSQATTAGSLRISASDLEQTLGIHGLGNLDQAAKFALIERIASGTG